MTVTVSFLDESDPGPSGPITDWLWDFGDGTAPSSDQNPVHDYAVAKLYAVVLQITGTGTDGTSRTVRQVDAQ